MKKLFCVAVLLSSLTVLRLPAQGLADPSTSAFQSLSTQQLEQLLEPIAVYPDPLIAQILPASTVPSQIVLAD
ncbi:MAG: DUF3300 domain-containing protein, partial [Lacunisphaera sp.]